MNSNQPVTLLPVAAVAIAVLLGACSNDPAGPDAAPTTALPSSTPTTPSSDQPIDLARVPEDTTLEGQDYLVPYLAGDGDRDPAEGPMRAVVGVPGGYLGGGPVIQSSSGNADAAFWGTVTRVATDACLGGSRPVGPTVRDLASALAAQRHMTATSPVPVTVGGYHGLYIKTVAPANLDRCRDKGVQILTGGGSWLSLDVPGATFREWILDVAGQRVVAGTRGDAHLTDEDPLNRMIESAEFTSLDDQ
jgi:hypothetical protein